MLDMRLYFTIVRAIVDTLRSESMLLLAVTLGFSAGLLVMALVSVAAISWEPAWVQAVGTLMAMGIAVALFRLELRERRAQRETRERFALLQIHEPLSWVAVRASAVCDGTLPMPKNFFPLGSMDPEVAIEQLWEYDARRLGEVETVIGKYGEHLFSENTVAIAEAGYWCRELRRLLNEDIQHDRKAAICKIGRGGHPRADNREKRIADGFRACTLAILEAQFQIEVLIGRKYAGGIDLERFMSGGVRIDPMGERV